MTKFERLVLRMLVLIFYRVADLPYHMAEREVLDDIQEELNR